MLKVVKYRIRIIDREVISMPKGAKILCVKTQQKIPCVFALVNDQEHDLEERVIRLYDTNRAINPEQILKDGYIGTIFVDDGELAYHVFEGVA